MTTGNSVGGILLIVLAIDMFLMLGQIAVADINPDFQFYNSTGNLIGTENKGNYELAEVTDLNSLLPTTTQSVTGDTDSGIFTEVFTNIKNWFLNTTGLSYLIMFINAVPNFLKAIGLPPILSFSLGALYHIITIFLAVSYIWGR